jgi:hypothetical protein
MIFILNSRLKFYENSRLVFLLPVFMILISGLYDIRRAADADETLRGIAFHASSLLSFICHSISSQTLHCAGGIAYFFVAAVISTLIWRMAYIRVSLRSSRRVILVGGETVKLY